MESINSKLGTPINFPNPQEGLVKSRNLRMLASALVCTRFSSLGYWVVHFTGMKPLFTCPFSQLSLLCHISFPSPGVVHFTFAPTESEELRVCQSWEADSRSGLSLLGLPGPRPKKFLEGRKGMFGRSFSFTWSSPCSFDDLFLFTTIPSIHDDTQEETPLPYVRRRWGGERPGALSLLHSG